MTLDQISGSLSVINRTDDLGSNKGVSVKVARGRSGLLEASFTIDIAKQGNSTARELVTIPVYYVFWQPSWSACSALLT